jgi:ssDNA-binding Zn-finger/Zn-ribbon topoisomerase 1
MERKTKKSNKAKIPNKPDKIETKINNDLCPRCGKYGKFKGCSNYPTCRFTIK